MKKKLILLFSILLLGSFVYAEDYKVLNYTNTRSSAMGKVTLSNMDETALLYNPAMLNTLKGHTFSLLTESMSMNDDGADLVEPLMDFYDDYDKIDNSENMIKLLNAYVNGVSVVIRENNVPKSINENENSINNKYLRGEFNSFVGGVKKHWGAAMMMSVKSNGLAVVNRPDGPIVDVDSDISIEVPIAGAFKISEKIDLGLSWRYIYGMQIKKELGANDLSALSEIMDDEITAQEELDKQMFDLIDLETANGWGTSLGLNFKSQKYIFSMGLQDLLSSLEVNHYVLINEGTDSEETVKEKIGDYKLPTNLRLGISNQPYNPNGQVKKILWAFELDNLLSKDMDSNGYDDTNFYKKIHAGGEYSLLNKKLLKLKLRSGLNQGYFSYGVGARVLKFIDFEYASYTEELGPHLGMKNEHFQKFALGIKF